MFPKLKKPTQGLSKHLVNADYHVKKMLQNKMSTI